MLLRGGWSIEAGLERVVAGGGIEADVLGPLSAVPPLTVAHGWSFWLW